MGKNTDIDDAITELEAEGRRLVREGHGFYLYCPCRDPRGRARIDSAPKNPSGQARRILREAGRCPDRHDLSGNDPRP